MYYKHNLWGKIWNKADYIIEWTSVVTIALYIYYTLYAYSVLPDEIPMHFNHKGQADRYDTKESIFVIMGIGLLLYFGMTFIQRFSSSYNYPVIKDPKNEERLEYLSLRLMRWVKLLCCILFIIITKSFFAGDQMRIIELVTLFIVVLLMLILPFYYIWKMSKLGRH